VAESAGRSLVYFVLSPNGHLACYFQLPPFLLLSLSLPFELLLFLDIFELLQVFALFLIFADKHLHVRLQLFQIFLRVFFLLFHLSDFLFVAVDGFLDVGGSFIIFDELVLDLFLLRSDPAYQLFEEALVLVERLNTPKGT
jgi:hypothetical protein